MSRPDAALLDLLPRAIGREDLSGVSLLDIGHGAGIARAILGRSLPIGHLTVIDFSTEVIDALRASVSDPRFEFQVLDARNEWLRPEGAPLESIDLLPVGSRRFDLITVLSVFTHMVPHDFEAMLCLVRRNVDESGTLLFSLHLIDAEHPSPFELQLRAKLNSEIPAERERAAAAIEQVLERHTPGGHDSRFIDEDPDEPLARASYTEDYAVELVEGSGWRIESIHPPQGRIDHHMICRPACPGASGRRLDADHDLQEASSIPRPRSNST